MKTITVTMFDYKKFSTVLVAEQISYFYELPDGATQVVMQNGERLKVYEPIAYLQQKVAEV